MDTGEASAGLRVLCVDDDRQTLQSNLALCGRLPSVCGVQGFSRARDALRRSEFGDRTGEQLRGEMEKDRAVLETLEEKEPDGRSGLFPAILCSFLAILTAAFYGVSSKLPLILAAGVCCVFAILFFLRYSACVRRARRFHRIAS